MQRIGERKHEANHFTHWQLTTGYLESTNKQPVPLAHFKYSLPPRQWHGLQE